MMRHERLEHRFVKNMPELLESGVLYVSMDYATATHSCCCGCGEEVVIPFTPTDWNMTYDGESISLNPSVGNWNLACRSHYVVRHGKVIEAGPWTDEEVDAERGRDRAAKERYFGTPRPDPSRVSTLAAATPLTPPTKRKNWFGRLWSRMSGGN